MYNLEGEWALKTLEFYISFKMIHKYTQHFMLPF